MFMLGQDFPQGYKFSYYRKTGQKESVHHKGRTEASGTEAPHTPVQLHFEHVPIYFLTKEIKGIKVIDECSTSETEGSLYTAETSMRKWSDFGDGNTLKLRIKSPLLEDQIQHASIFVCWTLYLLDKKVTRS